MKDRQGRDMSALKKLAAALSTTNEAASVPAPDADLHGLPANIAQLPSADRREKLRILEALLFAASEPLDETTLAKHLKAGDDVAALLGELQGFYTSRGINLIRVAGKWAFRTAEDLSYLLERHAKEEATSHQHVYLELRRR